MKTRNAMQLKAMINNKAKSAKVSPQLMLQNYMLERLIDRISRSPWRDRIIVKGGMLIGSLIGVDRRTTKDLDTTAQGLALTHEKTAEVFGAICAIDLDDDLAFEFLRTEDIREADEYPGIRIHLKAHYNPLAVPLTIDVTCGDRITPGAIVYEYPFAFDEGSATIMAYPVETIMAEKLETVLSRNVATTRPRDFYDIYELWRVRRDTIDPDILGDALVSTCAKRNSSDVIGRSDAMLELMRKDAGLERRWLAYAAKHSYASNLTFAQTLDTVERVLMVVSSTTGFIEAMKAGNAG